jgi:hypothetical protein
VNLSCKCGVEHTGDPQPVPRGFTGYIGPWKYEARRGADSVVVGARCPDCHLKKKRRRKAAMVLRRDGIGFAAAVKVARKLIR